jgi:hypothetical protein
MGIERENVAYTVCGVLGLVEQGLAVEGREIVVKVDGEKVERRSPFARTAAATLDARRLVPRTTRRTRETADLTKTAGIPGNEEDGCSGQEQFVPSLSVVDVRILIPAGFSIEVQSPGPVPHAGELAPEA